MDNKKEIMASWWVIEILESNIISFVIFTINI